MSANFKFHLPPAHIARRVLFLALFAALLYWAYARLASMGMSYEWQWNRVWRHFGQWTSQGFRAGPLLKGIGLTAAIAALGLFLSLAAGLGAAILRLSPWPFCAFLARLYIRLWRGTPLLLQLFFVYFLIAPIFGWGPLATAVIALGAFEGAYMAEIFRAALLSVPRGQWEAGLSLGFSLRQCLAGVIMPQALRNALPALTNQIIAIIKDTSLVSAIAVADLTLRAQALVAETFLAFEVWLLVGAIYLLLAMCAAAPAIWLEKRQNWR